MENGKFLSELLNNMFLGVSQLADSVPLGGKSYLEKVCNNYTERIFKQHKQNFKPESDKLIDLCYAWMDMAKNEELTSKEDFQLHNGGDSVHIIVNKHNCSYYKYCATAKKENLPLVCPRMLSFRWVASNFTGRSYQLVTEEFTDSDSCKGTISPGEIKNEILTKDGDNISIAGERAIVLSTNAFGVLVKTLYDYEPHILEQVLYESTYYSSVVEYDKIKDYYSEKREIIEHLMNTIARLGNIRYEIIEFDEQNKRAVVRGYNSYMAEIFRNNKLYTSPKVSCASARGRLAAYFTKAWGEEIVCEEIKCEAFGDNCCEFVLLPKRI